MSKKAYFRAYFYEEGMLNGIYAYTREAEGTNVDFFRDDVCKQTWKKDLYAENGNDDLYNEACVALYRYFAEYPVLGMFPNCDAMCRNNEAQTHFKFYGMEEVTEAEYNKPGPKGEFCVEVTREWRDTHDGYFSMIKVMPPSGNAGTDEGDAE